MQVNYANNQIHCDGGFDLRLNHFSHDRMRELPLAEFGPGLSGSYKAFLQVESVIKQGQLFLHLGVPALSKAGPSGLIGASISVDGRNIIDGVRTSKSCLLVRGGDDATVLLPLSRVHQLKRNEPGVEHVDLLVEYYRLRDISAINGAPQIDPDYTATDFGIGVTGVKGAGLSQLESPPPYEIHLRLHLDSREQLITELVRRVIDNLEGQQP